MYQLFVKGGPLMYPLAVCSILVLAVCVERLLMLRLSRVVPRKLYIELEDLLQREKFPEAVVLCKTSKAPIADILGNGLRHWAKSPDIAKEAMADAGRRQTLFLGARLPILTAIVGAAPMIGLLGTVIGILEVFKTIEAVGTSDIAMVAGGIYEALIATAAGLGIAIPALLAFKYFETRVDSLVVMLESETSALVAYLPEPDQTLPRSTAML